jgi:DnaJ-class molecular chaperone
MSAQWTERCAPCQGVGWRPTSSSTLDPEWQHCSWCRGRGQITYRTEDIETLIQQADARATADPEQR